MKSVQELAEKLGLRRAGGEYKGECPICGGDDRFHIKEGKVDGLLVYCRRGCTYAELMRELEKRGLVEKSEYTAPRYRHQDLDFADSILVVASGNVEQDFNFTKEDIVTIGDLMKKVDPGRKQLLHETLAELRNKRNEGSNG